MIMGDRIESEDFGEDCGVEEVCWNLEDIREDGDCGNKFIKL